MFTINITIDRDISFAKEMYNLYYGYERNAKVSKKELAIWFACLIEGDIDSQEINDEE